MIYLCGDNLLSAAQGQLMEQIRQAGASDQVKVAILIDQNQASDTRLYYLEGTTLVQQTWPTESNTDDPDTIVDFVTKIKTDLPGNNYALFLSSNKGSGWQGVCWDDHGRGQMITMPELLNALNTITNNGANKLQILGIETCMTGNMEVANQVQTCVEYFVAYPECAMAGEYPFVPSLNDLKLNPTQTPRDYAMDIVNHFVPHDYPQSRMKTCLAATDLSYLPTLETQIDDLAMFFIDHMADYKTQIKTAVEGTRVYAQLWYIDYYIDFYDFLDHCTITDTDFTTIKNSIQATMDTAVIADMHLPDDPCHGLSIYLPRRAGDYNSSLRYPELPSPYEETGFAMDTHWDEFLKTFLGIFNNTEPIKPTITGQEKGKKGTTYEYTISTTDPEDQQVWFWVDWGDDNNTGWLGPYNSSEELVLNHSWAKRGTYQVQVKAKDPLDAESEWATLIVKMAIFNPFNDQSSKIILFGIVRAIEEDDSGNFRFQPVFMLEINRVTGQNHTMKILTSAYGEYPCCGYLPSYDFNGIIRQRFIAGTWMSPT